MTPLDDDLFRDDLFVTTDRAEVAVMVYRRNPPGVNPQYVSTIRLPVDWLEDGMRFVAAAQLCQVEKVGSGWIVWCGEGRT